MVLDSGCSRHITKNRSKFTSLKKKRNEHVVFRDHARSKILGIGNVSSSSVVKNILLVECLQYNLLSAIVDNSWP